MCAPQTLATITSGGFNGLGGGIAVDDTTVYVFGQTDLDTLPKAGGKVTTLVKEGTDTWTTTSLTLAKGQLIWQGGQATARSVPTTGGTVSKTTNTTSVRPATLWASNGAAFYFTGGCNDFCRAALPSGTTTELYNDGCNSYAEETLVVDAANKYAYVDTIPPGGLGSQLWRVDVANGNVDTLDASFETATFASAMAIGPTALFWADIGGCSGTGGFDCTGTLRSEPLAGGPQTVVSDTLLGAGKNGIMSRAPMVLADSKSAVWFTMSENAYGSTVVEVPVAGGTPLLLLQTTDTIGGIAMDAQFVYLTDTGAGTVLRVAR